MTPSFQIGSSPIFTGPLERAFPVWLQQRSYSKLFFISDTQTSEFCLPVFLEKTGLGDMCESVVVPAGEDHKNLKTCENIWEAMLSARLDRKCLVINLGGGVVGDMGGFCAATWKRGVDFIQVPTTLLSMTDAAIGGKLGVDFQGVKNIIGVFCQPAAVFVDPAFLTTLPARALRSGFAEVIKHAIIGDPALYQQLSNGFKLSDDSPDRWLEILQASIAVKVRIVTEDPYEKGLRMLLNFGHTIGHAIESYFLETTAPLTHGEAIAIGMICEMYGDARRGAMAAVLLNYFPHTNVPEAAFPAIWELMQQDKKNSSGKVRMALPDELPYTIKMLEPTADEVFGSLSYYNGLV